MAACEAVSFFLLPRLGEAGAVGAIRFAGEGTALAG